MPQKAMTRWKAGVVVVLGGLSVGAVSLDALRSLTALRFHQAQGVVVSSSVKVGAKRSSRPIIEYRYSVAGQEFRGSRFAISDFDVSGTEFWAEGVVGKYPPGAACTVYYDPSDPEDSVLVRSVYAGTALIWVLMFGLGTALTCFGANWLRTLPLHAPRTEPN